MPYTLPPLPYALDALEPHIDAKTMEIHHGKHHQAYITNVNTALEGTGIDAHPIEEVLKNEIVARYYFQTGRYVASLNDDPYVKKALEVLNNGTLTGILSGSVKGQ